MIRRVCLFNALWGVFCFRAYVYSVFLFFCATIHSASVTQFSVPGHSSAQYGQTARMDTSHRSCSHRFMCIVFPFSIAAKIHIFNNLQSAYAAPEPITYFSFLPCVFILAVLAVYHSVRCLHQHTSDGCFVWQIVRQTVEEIVRVNRPTHFFTTPFLKSAQVS